MIAWSHVVRPTSASRFATVASKRLVRGGGMSHQLKRGSASIARNSIPANATARIHWAKQIAFGSLIGMGALQYAWGSTDNFYDYRYITEKDPDDVASFYGGEELMELFCIFPFVGTLMMRGATFDDEGNVHTTGFPGTMTVKMVFSDEEDEETGLTKWFNKRERFKNTLWGYTIWDLVINYGFRTLPDGRLECYHQGEYFHGYVPPFSLIVRAVFRIHSRIVVWATEHHINHHAFTSETEEEEEIEELSRKDIFWHLLKDHVWPDTMAMIFGSKQQSHASPSENQDTFLIKDVEDVSLGVDDEEESGGRPVTLRRFRSIGDDADKMKIIRDDISFDRSISQQTIKIDESRLGRKLSSSGNTAWEMLKKNEQS